MFLLAMFAAIAWYDGVTKSVNQKFTNWTDQKYANARNKWSAKKEKIRGKKGPKGWAGRGGLNVLDAIWSFCAAVAEGSRGTLDRAREMRDEYKANPDEPRRKRMRKARRPQEAPAQNSAQDPAQPKPTSAETPKPAPAQTPATPQNPPPGNPSTPKGHRWDCRHCGAFSDGYATADEAQLAKSRHPCEQPIPSRATPRPNNQGEDMTDVQTLEQLRIANARRVAAAVAELEDATADKTGADEDLARAEGECRTITALAEAVAARWNAQTAAPYLEMASHARKTREGATTRVEVARSRVRSAQASVEATQKATAEVEKLAAADEAMRNAGFKTGVNATSSNAA